MQKSTENLINKEFPIEIHFLVSMQSPLALFLSTFANSLDDGVRALVLSECVGAAMTSPVQKW